MFISGLCLSCLYFKLSNKLISNKYLFICNYEQDISIFLVSLNVDRIPKTNIHGKKTDSTLSSNQVQLSVTWPALICYYISVFSFVDFLTIKICG